MKNRYLGKTGEDKSILSVKLADFGKGANEYFEEIGLIMTNGVISVTAPTKIGKIEKVKLLQRSGIYPTYEYSIRVWFFNKPTTTQVLRQMQNFTSSDMDGLIGFTEFRSANYPTGLEQVWRVGATYSGQPDNTALIENLVDIPFILDETQKIYIIGENIGDPITYSDTTTYVYLHLKLD